MPRQTRESAAIAYLITFHSYGTWLHGNDCGSVDKFNNWFDFPNIAPNPPRELSAKRRLKSDPFKLSQDVRIHVERTIRDVAVYRSWQLYAINVRSNHVHVVVSADETPEKVMNDFKSWSTRRLRESNLVKPNQQVWARHGSTIYLWNEKSLTAACDYVIDGQGDFLS